MPLKPSDIEQKTFSTALRGYDLNEVDDFLDDVIATIRDLEEQAKAKGGRQPLSSSDPAPDESAVGRALIAAQNAADQILASARDEAERIKEEARGETDSWVKERDQKKAEAQQQIGELRLRVDNVRRELAVLATVVADGLDEMDVSIMKTESSVAATGSTEDDQSADLDDTPADEVIEESGGDEPSELMPDEGEMDQEDLGESPDREPVAPEVEAEVGTLEESGDETGSGSHGSHELSDDVGMRDDDMGMGDLRIEVDDTEVEETVNSD
jgi:cell division initiation protein